MALHCQLHGATLHAITCRRRTCCFWVSTPSYGRMPSAPPRRPRLCCTISSKLHCCGDSPCICAPAWPCPPAAWGAPPPALCCRLRRLTNSCRRVKNGLTCSVPGVGNAQGCGDVSTMATLANNNRRPKLPKHTACRGNFVSHDEEPKDYVPYIGPGTCGSVNELRDN